MSESISDQVIEPTEGGNLTDASSTADQQGVDPQMAEEQVDTAFLSDDNDAPSEVSLDQPEQSLAAEEKITRVEVIRR